MKKFSELNKNQKQLLILAVGGSLTLLLILTNLVLKPAKESAKRARKTIEKIEGNVNRGESLLKRDRLIREDARKFSAEILEIQAQHLPPEISRYIWALERISSLGEELKLQLTVQEHASARYLPVRDVKNFHEDSIPMWVTYAVEVEIFTGFANLKNFLTLLRERDPYCSVASLRVGAMLADPENHEIKMVLEWPVLRFAEDSLWIQEQTKEGGT